MIKSFDYLKSLPEIEADLLAATTRVLRSGRLILGSETEAFEHEFAAFTGAKHCIGMASGTAALQLAFMALGIGSDDEVITVSNTCVPTVAAIRLTGARPVFIDVSDDDLMMDVDLVEQAITRKTRCLLPVHLWGRAANLSRLTLLAVDCGLSLVEDCAQATGTTYNGRQVGTFGDMGCFSFYPTKTLGSMGDAGAVITNSDDLADRLRKLRFYGYSEEGEAIMEGTNARISEMQAAILRVKLKTFPEWLTRRRAVASLYNAGIRSQHVSLPSSQQDIVASWHQYVIRTDVRQGLMAALRGEGIESAIHYPMPVHLMTAYKHFGRNSLFPVTVKAAQEILSLPIHESVSSEEAQQVISTINQYGGSE
jgi:dTDP-4-amino-4,6-dideoxygalactose transaminase